MLEIGFTSGCLTVVSNDFQKNYESFLQSLEPLALQEWNRFDDWEPDDSCSGKRKTFEAYYNLDETERNLFGNKAKMPFSFMEKYYSDRLRRNRHFVLHLSNVLWHKKNPDTGRDLIKALVNFKLYEVKCNICNRTYFMDEMSITCVKWRSCVGSACLSSTVSNEICTYSNLCKVNEQSTALQISNAQLSDIEKISGSLSYYGGYDDLHISYISDIHLLHHLNDDISLQSLLNASIRNLYRTMDNRGIILFAGDISSDAILTVDFYTRFIKYNDYLFYLEEKKKLLDAKKQKNCIDSNKRALEIKIARVEAHIKTIKEELSPYLDFDIVVQYKKRNGRYRTWAESIKTYKKTSSYKSKNISDKCDRYLDLIAPKLDLLEQFEEQLSECAYNYNIVKQRLSGIEISAGKSIEDLTISDVYKKHHLLSEEREIYAVLGNHEYIGFDSVSEAVHYFEPKFEAIGIHLLHNNYYEFPINGKTFVIFGGTGFAKYNLTNNADTLICCNNFTRVDEVKESSLFEKAYLEAKQYAKDKACFICVSHYPIRDCSAVIDNDSIYFYGHNHQNFYRKNENETIYADNQIGYESANIAFKTMTTGTELNPYLSLTDGLYKTTVKDYLQFYRYIGESIGDGTLLYQRCQNNKANIYVIKRKGYYGFFIMNPNAGAAKGISIVSGGKTKRITRSTDLQWLFDNFESVLYKYLQALTPLRMLQEQFSDELMKLGFEGTIHGCIIDIDFYHHIMINPFDGTVTYYYSSSFGMIRPISSFENVIKSVQSHDIGWFSSNRDYDWVRRQFKKNQQKQNYVLSKVNEAHLLEMPHNETALRLNTNEQIVSCSEGMYGVSRKVNSLQRLFDGHTLRDFDLALVESEPETSNKTKSKVLEIE